MATPKARRKSPNQNLLPKPRRKKVIIVGAGLAGLVSAYELAKKGQEVVVLEARDRVGGRVETLRKPFTDNYIAEAGAYWLNDRHSIAMGYILEFNLGGNLTHVPLSEAPLYYHLKKTPFETRFRPYEQWPNSFGLKNHEKNMGLGGMLGSIFCSHALLGNPGEKDWPPESVKQKYGSMSFREFLQSPHWRLITRINKAVPYIPSKGAIELVFPWFAWWHENLHEVSALSMIEYGAVGLGLSGDTTHPSKWFTAKRGMDFLPKAFEKELKKLGVTICKNVPVVAIKQEQSSICVKYLHPSEKTKRLVGDYLISAIPLTTLKKIKFEPQLSGKKWELIKRVQYASVARAYVQGKKKFFDLKNSVGFTDRAMGNLLDMSFHHNKGPGKLLQAFMIGNYARDFGRKSTENRQTFMVKQIQSVFPGFTKNNIASFTDKCWDDDPWALGAYPIFTPEQFLSREELGRAEGLLHFAGEHTSEYTTWMEGALRSGQRAAAEVGTAIFSSP